MSDTDWRDEAACAGMDLALWGAGKKSTPEQLLKGKTICATRCNVVNDCLRDAFKHEASSPAGMATIRAGLTKEERARLRNRPNSRNNQPMILTEKEHRRRCYMAARVKDDATAATYLGVDVNEYRIWRQRYFGDSPAPPDIHRLNTPTEEAMRLNSHAAGMTDPQIAVICKTSRWAIQRWRQRRNLPPNKPRVTA